MSMTRRTLMMVAASLGLFAAATFAVEGTVVKAEVPFAFIAGNETLPAGSYVFRLEDPAEPEALFIESSDGTRHEFLLTETGPVPQHEPALQSKLVFDRFGKERFLAEVWVAGQDEGRTIPMDRIQRERTRQLEHERLSVPLHEVG